jgi:myosin protein heavy chain
MDRTRDNNKAKLDSFERDARQSKEQLAELARTATNFENIIQRKEAEIARLTSEISSIKRDREASVKLSAELQAQIETLVKELEAQKDDRERLYQSRSKLEDDLDELRALMAAKTSEDTKRSEVERSKEQELLNLRSQASELRSELASVRRTTTESQNKLKVELETAQREHASVIKSQKDIQAKAQTHQQKLAETELALAHAEKQKRAAESELQSVRARQIEADGQVAEAVKAKEVKAQIISYFSPSANLVFVSSSNDSSPQRRPNTKTLKTQCFKLNVRKLLGSVRWRRRRSSWRRKFKSVPN